MYQSGNQKAESNSQGPMINGLLTLFGWRQNLTMACDSYRSRGLGGLMEKHPLLTFLGPDIGVLKTAHDPYCSPFSGVSPHGWLTPTPSDSS